jgi:hypothetical protein
MSIYTRSPDGTIHARFPWAMEVAKKVKIKKIVVWHRQDMRASGNSEEHR